MLLIGGEFADVFKPNYETLQELLFLMHVCCFAIGFWNTNIYVFDLHSPTSAVLLTVLGSSMPICFLIYYYLVMYFHNEREKLCEL